MNSSAHKTAVVTTATADALSGQVSLRAESLLSLSAFRLLP